MRIEREKLRVEDFISRVEEVSGPPEPPAAQAGTSIQREKQSVESFVSDVQNLADVFVNVQQKIFQITLLKEVTRFLMAAIAATLLLLYLHSNGDIELPEHIVDNSGWLLGGEFLTLLTSIVGKAMALRKNT